MATFCKPNLTNSAFFLHFWGILPPKTGLNVLSLAKKVRFDGVRRCQMRETDGEGIRRVGSGRFREAEHGAHHERDLLFTGTTPANGCQFHA
jgi:hypothetical protein